MIDVKIVIDTFVEKVKAGIIDIEKVPEVYREEVREKL